MLEPSKAVANLAPNRIGKHPDLPDRVCDELCDLWSQLFLSLPADRPKRLLITAAGRGEGVSHVACAMALAAGLHQTDHSVALVDLNVRHPRVARLMRVPNVPGVAEVLTAVSGLDAALRAFEGTVLGVLPAGGRQTRPLSLLAGRPIKDLFEELSERYDHVLIDAPAVNCHPEAQILAPMVDGVLLVVRAGQTSREAVLQAKKRLHLAQARLLGVVLNDRVYPLPEFLYRRL